MQFPRHSGLDPESRMHLKLLDSRLRHSGMTIKFAVVLVSFPFLISSIFFRLFLTYSLGVPSPDQTPFLLHT